MPNAKYLAFGTPNPKKHTFMRCVKCQKILRHTIVPSYLWHGTDQYGMCLILLYSMWAQPAMEIDFYFLILINLLSPLWSPSLLSSLHSAYFKPLPCCRSRQERPLADLVWSCSLSLSLSISISFWWLWQCF